MSEKIEADIQSAYDNALAGLRAMADCGIEVGQSLPNRFIKEGVHEHEYQNKLYLLKVSVTVELRCQRVGKKEVV